MKSILQGFGFGVGLSMAVAIAMFVASRFQAEPLSEQETKEMVSRVNSEEVSWQQRNRWQGLPIDAKLEEATALAIVRFKPGEDGANHAFVEKLIRSDPSVELDLEIGDRRKKQDFYSEGGNSRDRNGEVTFYIGNPGKEVGTSYLYEDRLIGEGNIPLEIALKKYQRE